MLPSRTLSKKWDFYLLLVEWHNLTLTSHKIKMKLVVHVLPPSSSGLGRSPLKAKTGVRVP